MPSLLPGYEYDVFISYRQNDNRSGWVTQFVEDLRKELAATIKDPVTTYFDENPHDGLQPTHHVDKSLEGKLKCLIFIPVLSHTYCDSKSFAWTNEFIPFAQGARLDSLGLDIRLWNGNVASRVLPVQIHDLDPRDLALYEEATGSPVRSIEFIFRSSGVNRPLTAQDIRSENISKTLYRDQINKTANAIEELMRSLSSLDQGGLQEKDVATKPHEAELRSHIHRSFWSEVRRRNVLRASVAYLIVGLLVLQVAEAITPILELEESTIRSLSKVLLALFPIAVWLAWQYEVGPGGIIRTSAPESISNPYSSAKKKPLTSGPMIFVLTLSIALLAIYLRIIIGQPDTPPNEPVAMVVLPFESRGATEENKYLADGITEDIINRLTGTGKVVVRTQSATQQLLTKAMLYPEIANRLEVSYILKGTIEHSEGWIRVTVQLLNKDGNYLWGDTFPQRISDLLTLQSEIVSRIVSKLRIKLREFQEYRLTKDPTNSASAFECYARGRVLYYRRRSGANDSAIAEFRRAIQLDSNYAQAWAGLGDALAQRHGRFGHEYFWTDSALASSQRAIDLDTALADGYKAKAVAYSYRKEYDKAIALLHKAVQISPTYVQAVGNLGANYLSKRDLTNALKWEILSAGFEPSNWIPRQQIGWIYRLLGDHPQAVTTLRQSMEKPGGIQYDTFEHLGYTYVAMGRKKDALRLIEELLDTEEKNTRVYETAGLIAHFAGEPGMAETYFEKSIELNSNYKDDRNTFSPLGLGQIRYTQGNAVEGEIFLSHAMYNFKTDLENGSQSADLPYYIAAVHAIRGERAEALTWIRKAMERNWLDHAMIEFGPYFTRYRSDKEFKDIVALLKSKTERMLKEVSTNR